MRKLIFPVESKDSKIGVFELCWTCVQLSTLPLTVRDHYVISRLKKALRSISEYKDDDRDSRILTVPGPLLLEEDEYALLKKLIESSQFISAVSDLVTGLWDIIENAEPVTLNG